MISVHPCTDVSTLDGLKAAYRRSLTAPMDGMWDSGFTEPAPHWEIRNGDQRIGYFVANEEGNLLQFFVAASTSLQKACFDVVRSHPTIQLATVSTIDPSFLSLCLDVHRKIEVHTLQYALPPAQNVVHSPNSDCTSETQFRPVDIHELDQIIPFQQGCLGGDQDLSGWLRGYSNNLIDRKELFVLENGIEWIGLGEFRKSETQPGIVDLGMMVSPNHRGQGWASDILRRLAGMSQKQKLRPICSTTVENRAAQMAIERSGFSSNHRIMSVHF